MKKTMQRVLAVVLACLLLCGTATVGFAASVGQVTKLSLASRSTTLLKLKWKAVSGVSGYVVEDYNGSQWKTVGTTSKTAYTDTVQPGSKHTYRVRAYVMKNGAKSFGKTEEKITVMSNPERVTGLKVAAVSATAVKLKWAKAKGASAYVIYQSRSANGSYKKLGTAQSTSYKATYKASPGTLYYKVRALAKDGKTECLSEPGSAVKAKLVPDAVTDLAVKESGSKYVTLKWKGGKGASAFLIFQRDVTSGKEFVQIGKTAKKTYKVKFPAAPGKIYFKVQAYSKVSGVVSKAKASEILKLNIKPAKVTSLALKSAGATKLNLVWNAADGASSYEVYMFNAEKQDYDLLDTVKKPAYTVTGLKPSTDYRFAVKSVADYKGNILRSGFSKALNASTVLGSIVGFDFSLDSQNKVFLTWNEVKGADGYEIEKSPNGNDGWKVIGDVQSTVFEASAVESGKVLAKGNKYFYRVRAHAKEDGETLYTDYSEVAEVHPIPDAPKITRTGTAAQHAVCIEWTAVTGADGYEVFLYDSATNKWISRVNENALVGSGLFKTYTNEKGEKTVYFCDQGLTKSGNNQYKVRAVVKNHNLFNFSEFSNTVTHEYIHSPEPQKYYDDATQKTGIVGYLYDPQEDCFCTAEDPWQRNFGFNKVYDIASQAVMIQYDTDPIQFTCHEGEEWMIQPWKGQYGMVLYGGEIGVYKKYSERDADHYDCARDEDMLMMEMDLYKYNYDNQSWDHAFHRPYGSYWWITGFKFGFVRFVNPLEAQSFRTYKDIYIDARITMMDFDMFNAFKAMLDAQIAKEKKLGDAHMSYTIGEAAKGTSTGPLDIYLKFQ